MNGGAGDDMLTGSDAADRIDGGAGNDTLLAREGKPVPLDGAGGFDRAQIDDGLDRAGGVESIVA